MKKSLKNLALQRLLYSFKDRPLGALKKELFILLGVEMH
jgi:hypothetical protein